MSGRLGEGHNILRDLERLGSKQARFTGDEHAGSDNPRDGTTIPAVRTSSNASATKDTFGSSLSDVSQRLQRLEQQVRSQLTSKANTGPAPGQGRSALRQSLIALKDDVMSLAVSEVESQLLLQRLATLERAVARPSSAGPGWLASDPGTSSPNMLAARLSGLEGALNELAAYQVTNSALLHHLGGRLSPGPGGEGSGAASAAASASAAPSGGMPGQAVGSPGGAGAAAGGMGGHGPRASEPPMRAAPAPSGMGAFAYSTSGAPHVPRGYSPGPYPYPPPLSPGMPGPGDISVAASGYYGEGISMHTPPPSGRISSGYPGARASPEPTGYGMLSPGRHVEVLVNAHEGELAGLRTAVGRLDAERRLAAVATGQMAEEVSNVAARLVVVERGLDRVAAAAAVGGQEEGLGGADAEALQGMSQALEEVASRLAALEDRAAAGDSSPTQELSATGLATSAAGSASPEQQQILVSGVATLQLQVQQLGMDLMEVTSSCKAAQQDAAAAAADAAGSHRMAAEGLQGVQQRLEALEEKQLVVNPLFGGADTADQVLEQLLASDALQQLIAAKVAAAVAAAADQQATAAAATAAAAAAAVAAAGKETAAAEEARAQEVAALQGTVAHLSSKLATLEAAQQEAAAQQAAKDAAEAAGVEHSLAALQGQVAALANVEEVAAQVAAQQAALQQAASRLEVMDSQLQQLMEQRDTAGLLAGAVSSTTTSARSSSSGGSTAAAVAVAAIAAEQVQALEERVMEFQQQLAAQEAAAAAAATTLQTTQQQLEALQQQAGQALSSLPEVQAAVTEQGRQLSVVAMAMERHAVLEEGTRALAQQLLGVQRDAEASHHLIQRQIEQLSQQLMEVNAAATDEEDLSEVRAQVVKVEGAVEALQASAAEAGDLAQLGEQVGTLGKHVAEVVALVKEVPALREQVAGVVAAQQGLVAAQELSVLQEQAADAKAQLQQLGAALDALQGQQKEQGVRVDSQEVALAAQAAELSAQVSSSIQKLQAQLGEAAAARAAIQEALVQQVDTTDAGLRQLREWVEQRDDGLQEQLRQQVETMAQILVDTGASKAEQAAALAVLRQALEDLRSEQTAVAADLNAAQTALAKHMQQVVAEAQDAVHAQLQGPSGLQATVDQMATTQAAVCAQVSELEELVGSCATAAAVTALSSSLRGLGGKVEQLSAIMEQLGAAQRAMDGTLANEQEQLADQRLRLASLQQDVAALPCAGHLQQLWADLTDLLAPLQEDVAELGSQLGAVKEQRSNELAAVKSDLLTVLEGQQEQLATAIDELQAVVTERCVKTDQLARIFAARDDMYESWSKMQAVFDSQSKASAQVLFRVRPTMSRAPSATGSVDVSSAASGVSSLNSSGKVVAVLPPVLESPHPVAAAAAVVSGLQAALSRVVSRANSTAADQQLSRSFSLASAPSTGAESAPTSAAAVAAPASEAGAVPHAAGADVGRDIQGPSEGGFSLMSSSSYVTALSVAPGDAAMASQLTQLGAAVAALQEGLAGVQQQLAATATQTTALAAAGNDVQDTDEVQEVQEEFDWVAAEPAAAPSFSTLAATETAAAEMSAAAEAVAAAAPAASAAEVEALAATLQQLQEELSSLKEAAARKEQFAALALTLRDLRETAASTGESTAAQLSAQAGQMQDMSEALASQSAQLQQVAADLKGAGVEQQTAVEQQQQQLEQMADTMAQLQGLPAAYADLQVALAALQATVECSSSAGAVQKEQQAAESATLVEQLTQLRSDVASQLLALDGKFEQQEVAVQQLRGQLEAVAGSVESLSVSAAAAAAKDSSSSNEQQQEVPTASQQQPSQADAVAAAVMEVKTALLAKLAEADTRLAALEALGHSPSAALVKKAAAKKPSAIPHAPASGSGAASPSPSAAATSSSKVGKGRRRASGTAAATPAAAPAAPEQPAAVEPAAAAAETQTCLDTTDATTSTAGAAEELPLAPVAPDSSSNTSSAGLAEVAAAVEAVNARLEELTAAQAALQQEQAKLVESQSKANLRAMASKHYGLAFSQGTGDLDELWDVVNRLTASVDLLEAERGQQLGVLSAIREEVAATAAAAAAATATAGGTKTPSRSRSPAVAPGAEEECVGEEGTLAEDVSVLSLQLRALTASVESLQQQHLREAAEAAAAAGEDGEHVLPSASEDAPPVVLEPTATTTAAAAALSAEQLSQRLTALEEVQSEVSQLKQGTQQLAAQLSTWVGRAAAAGEDVAKMHLVSSTLADQLDALQHQVAAMAAGGSSSGTDAAAEVLQQAQAQQGEQIRDLTSQVSVLEGLVRQASPLVHLAEEVGQLQGEHRDLAALVGRLQQQQQVAVAAMGATLQQLQEQQGSLVQGLGSLQAAQEQLAAEVTCVNRVSPGVVTPSELALAPVVVTATSGLQAAAASSSAGDGELTFDDLAGAPSPSMRVMAQRVVMSVADETLAAAASPTGQQAGNGAGEVGSPTSSAAGEVSRDVGTAMTPTSSSSSSSELLGAQLGLMTPAHQTAFLHKLLQVVEAHAGRLVRQYATHPELAEQLTQVQGKLSDLKQQVPAAAGASPAHRLSSSSSSSPSAARAFARTSSNNAAAGMGAAGGEVLLSILDQVASLRAIGSQTHPALVATIQSQQAALEKLAEQLSELKEHSGLSSEASGRAGAEAAAAAAFLTTPGAPAPGAGGSSAAVGEASVGDDAGDDGGRVGARVTALEGQVVGALRALGLLRDRLLPLQEYLDSSQAMMRELQVVHGDVVRRVDGLEAAEAQAAAVGLSAAAGNTLRKVQEDMASLGRRLAAAEAGAASASEALAGLRRLSARVADSDARAASSAARLASIAATLPVLTGQVAATEQRVGGKLASAFKVLDNLADQLAALGTMPRPQQKSQALAALDPHYKSIQSIDAKMEAVRTALTASTRHLLNELSSDAAASAVRGGAAASSSELEAAAKVAAVAAEEAARGAAGSHAEAMKALEARLVDVSGELSTRLAFTAGELDDRLAAQGSQLAGLAAALTPPRQ